MENSKFTDDEKISSGIPLKLSIMRKIVTMIKTIKIHQTAAKTEKKQERPPALQM